MKIIVTTRSEQQVENCDYRGAICINVDGKDEFNFSDGEPEDATLGRDFSGVYNITKMMQAAHNAGKNGKPFDIEEVESDEI